MTEHISKQYDQDLEAIRSRMMQMGGLVEAHIRAAVAGYLDGDVAKANQVIAGDAKVNELELAVVVNRGEGLIHSDLHAGERLAFFVLAPAANRERGERTHCAQCVQTTPGGFFPQCVARDPQSPNAGSHEFPAVHQRAHDHLRSPAITGDHVPSRGT